MYDHRRTHAATLLVPGALLTAILLAPGPAARAQDPAPEQPAPQQPAVEQPDPTPAPPDQTQPTGGSDEESQPRRPTPRFRIGPEVGLFLPTDSKTRDRFGDSWFSVGVGLGGIREYRTQGGISLDLNVITHKRGDNRALFIPIGLGYYKALAPGPTRPYIGGSVNLYLADLRAPADGVRSGLRAGGGGSVFSGLTLSGNAAIEIRYYLASRIRGFDLSGLNLRAGFRF